jgi:hypothetical protein
MANSNFHDSLKELMIHGNATQALRHLVDGGRYPSGQQAGPTFLRLMRELPLVSEKLGIGAYFVSFTSSLLC